MSSNTFYNEIQAKSLSISNAKKDEKKAKLSADADLIEKEATTFISNSNTDILVNYTRNKGIGDFTTKKQGGVEVLVSELQNLEDPGYETTTSNSDVSTEHRYEEDYENNFDQDDQYEQD